MTADLEGSPVIVQAFPNTFAVTLGNGLATVANHYQQLNLAVPDYLPVNVQDWIFDQIDHIHGRSLWALLRYLGAANKQGNGN